MSALDPIDLLGGLVIEDDRTTWGQRATRWQRADARAILRATRTRDRRLFFDTRPRGGSKTTDTAAVALVVMLTQSPARSTSFAYARDEEQAGILLATMRAIAERSGLAPLFDFGASTVTVKATGATLTVQSSDAGSTYGRLPYLVICDELAQWPDGARKVFTGIFSGLPKVSDSRLVVLTQAGDPAHWSAKVLESARTSPMWRVSEVPGPLPWMPPEWLAEQKRMLTESEYLRLHENRWTAAEDRLVKPEDLAACVTLDGTQPYDSRWTYQLGLDLGWVNDATVMTVCHAEPAELGPTIVLDEIVVMHGTKEHPVQIADVKRLVQATSRRYGHARLRLDPREAVAMAQELRDFGMTVDDRQLTVASVGSIGGTLHLLLRERRMRLPNDPDLIDELLRVRLEQTSLGGLRLNHDAGQHDDRAMSLGLAALALIERVDNTAGSGFSIPGDIAKRMGIERGSGPRSFPGAPGRPAILNAAYKLGGSRGTMAALRRAARDMPTGINSLPVEGSANSPDRVRRERPWAR